MDALRVDGVSFEYRSEDRSVQVLNDVSLAIRPGEFVAIRGPSGSGKSTLFYLLGCLLRPTSGKVWVNGQDVSRLDDETLAYVRNREIGFVFQQFHLIPRASVLENILLPAQYPWELKREPGEMERAEARARELAAKLGIGDRLEHSPNQLSGGQQQRVAIARALMNDAPLILADEPTGNLDSASAAQVLDELIALNRRGKTIVLITHDDEVARRCSRVLQIRDGRLQDEPARDAPGAEGGGGSGAAVTRVGYQKGRSPFWRALPLVRANVRRNRVKSMLTMIGVTIGIAAVLSMVTLGQYTRDKVLEGYESMGVNQLLVRGDSNREVRATDEYRVAFRAFEVETDLIPLQRVFPEIRRLSPVARAWNTSFTSGGKRADDGVRVMGVHPEFLPITQREVILGKPFGTYHVANRVPVCLIGVGIARQLFGTRSPIGEVGSVIVNERSTYPCRIIGVLSPQSSSRESSPPDFNILLPLTYYQSVATNFWEARIREFVVQLDPKVDIAESARRIKAYFEQKYGRSGRFRVDAEAILVNQMRTFLRLFAILLGAIAFLSLVVGGIGIHNMMLVSVAEQMRDIGLRKAVGATRRSVRYQVLMESVWLCTVAGVIGLIMGFVAYEGLIFMASKVIRTVRFEWIVDPWAMLLSAGSIVLVGVISGLTPALRAERLEVIEALRSE